MTTPANPLDDHVEVEFADNPEPRAPALLVIDRSGSETGEAIDQINAGLKAFEAAIKADPLTSVRVEVAIVTFGSDVTVLDLREGTGNAPADVDAFVGAMNFTAPTLVAGGTTALGAGTLKALEILRARKAAYKATGTDYFRPFMFIMTDGGPTDEWQSAAAACRDEELRKGVTVFPIGAGSGAAMDVLKQFSSKGMALQMAGLEYGKLFEWLSKSVGSVAQSRLGDQVALPPVPGGIVIDTSV